MTSTHIDARFTSLKRSHPVVSEKAPESPTGPVGIALIVCTRNRATATLPACLEAAAAIDFDPSRWELVVVDNGSTDGTAVAVRAFAVSARMKVTFVQEPRIGQGVARNSGVLATSAPLIVFTDDDCYVAPDYLTQIVDAFGRADYGYIGGRVLLHDPTDARTTIREAPWAEEFAPLRCLEPGVIHGANMAFRRDVWQAVGGFDPLLGPGQIGAGDDIDFLTRASALGWKGAYLPGPTVRHHHGRKPGPEVRRLVTIYARGRGAYYVKCCLNRSIRGRSLWQWSWHLGGHVRHGRLRSLWLELYGAVDYLFRRAQLAE
jgi:glycosyltransferase involved in cell wall biosynthesis